MLIPAHARSVQSRGEYPKAGATQGNLPKPSTLLRATDWILLNLALGPAADVPAALGRLLDDDPALRAGALDHLEKFLHHQNTIYPATVPVALYLAAILPDPRAAAVGVHRRGDWSRPQRAVLIDWLGEMADDVRDDAVEIRRRHGFADCPPIDELRAHRGAISRAVAAFLDDPDPDTLGKPPSLRLCCCSMSQLSRPGATTSVHGSGACRPTPPAAITACGLRTACASGERCQHRDSPPPPMNGLRLIDGPVGMATTRPSERRRSAAAPAVYSARCFRSSGQQRSGVAVGLG